MLNNTIWHNHSINKKDRSKLKNQKSCILWFTGLSGSGKSTIANMVESELFKLGKHTYLLDGDNIRFGLNKGLGFSDKDRGENIKRVGEIAKLFSDAGIIVLSALISPFQKDRDNVRSLVEGGEFIEIYIDTSLEICKDRDPKGLYKKAINGEIANFTGISSRYEIPKNPDIIIKTNNNTIKECANIIINYLDIKGYLQ